MSNWSSHNIPSMVCDIQLLVVSLEGLNVSKAIVRLQI